MVIFVTPVGDAMVFVNQAMARQGYVPTLRRLRENAPVPTESKRHREAFQENKGSAALPKDIELVELVPGKAIKIDKNLSPKVR